MSHSSTPSLEVVAKQEAPPATSSSSATTEQPKEKYFKEVEIKEGKLVPAPEKAEVKKETVTTAAIKKTTAELPKKEPFTVQYIEIRDEITKEIVEKNAELKIIDQQLVNTLKQVGIAKEDLFDQHPKLLASELITYLPQLKNLYGQYVNNYNHALAENVVGPLVKFLEKEYEWLTKKIEAMVKEGKIGFKQLWYLFQKEQKFYTRVEDELVGSEVKSTRYQRSMFSTAFVITGEVINTDGRRFFSMQKTFSIPNFSGVKEIKSLNVKPLNPEEPESQKVLEELAERGKKFEGVGIGTHYMQYHGNILRKNWFFTNLYRADGRIMVDYVSFVRMNPNYTTDQAQFGNQNAGSIDSGQQHIAKDKLFMCWPFVFGFSFFAKKWGELAVGNVSAVQFDEEAFDRLVLPVEKKTLIKALVEYGDQTFSDIISGKGAGIIFLLHGSPGVGKTLTAEAISEHMKRPLYSVSVGELGTDTNELENRLREILEVASIWKAVILIDEADIFLERRTENDIKRNAMVGVFLRLLEYHQGILFLTTNRVKCFDEAFHSRVSIAIKYHDLDDEARTQIWQNFLEVAKITGMDTKKLGQIPLNGRQIKNIIRLAQSLAFDDGVQLTMKHIEATVEVTRQFVQSANFKKFEEEFSSHMNLDEETTGTSSSNDEYSAYTN